MPYAYAIIVILLTYWMGWHMGRAHVLRAFNLSLRTFAISYVNLITGMIRGAVTGEENEDKIAQILDNGMEMAKTAHVTLYKTRREV